MKKIILLVMLATVFMSCGNNSRYVSDTEFWNIIDNLKISEKEQSTIMTTIYFIPGPLYNDIKEKCKIKRDTTAIGAADKELSYTTCEYLQERADKSKVSFTIYISKTQTSKEADVNTSKTLSLYASTQNEKNTFFKEESTFTKNKNIYIVTIIFASSGTTEINSYYYNTRTKGSQVLFSLGAGTLYEKL